MKLTQKLVALLAGLMLSATGAAAVTVSVSVTGELDYIVYDNEPEVATTLAIGDTFTFGFDLDLDQTAGPGIAFVTRAGEVSRRAVSYQTGAATLDFDSGPSFDLGTQTITVLATEMDPGVVEKFGRNRYYRDVTIRKGVFSGPDLLVDIFGKAGRDSAPYGVALSDTLLGFDSLDTGSSEMYMRSNILGAPDDACSGGYCLVLLKNISTTIIGTIPVDPIDPTVTPVPVPAPFLMLGMAMLGLVGFGRRAKV